MTHVSPGSRTADLIETRLRVATWNIWWRFGDWERREPLIRRVLGETAPDIVCLQEVWDDGAENQAKRIADDLGYHHVYEPVLEIDGIRWGMAILGRWPVSGHRGLALPSMPSADRSRDCRAMFARVAGPRGDVGVVCTHLSWRPEESRIRQRQVGAICEVVRDQGQWAFPPVVCGDFNAGPMSDEIRMMTGEAIPPVEGLFFHDAWPAAGRTEPGFTWDNGNPLTNPALQPNRRLDYVFVGGPRPDGAGHVLSAEIAGNQPTKGLYPSDHFALVVDLRY